MTGGSPTGSRRFRTKTLIVGLDIGTSSTRALIYDGRGRLQPDGERQVAYRQTITSDGGVFTDPDNLVKLTLAALRGLLSSLGPSERRAIVGVGVSCFWHSLMGIDRDGRAVTPLYSWADTRSSASAENLANRWDADKYHTRTGAFIHSSYWPAKLDWLKRTDPGKYSRVDKWISFSDYLALKLFGELSTSISMASATGLFNQSQCDWDQESLDALSIDRAALPAIATTDLRSQITTAGARGLSALEKASWLPAYGDGATSNVGAGGASQDTIVVNVGTSGAIRVLAPETSLAPHSALFSYRADRSRILVGGAMSNGGNIYAWLGSTLGVDSAAAKRIDSVRRRRPDGHGLTVLPYLAGERSPGWRPDAHGVVSGINLHTTADDISLAMLESVVYPFHDVLKQLRMVFSGTRSITISGGAFKHSNLMAQLFADVFGCELQLCRESEPSGHGAALLAAEALGYGSIEHAPHLRTMTVKPNMRRHVVYVHAMERYRELYGMVLGSRRS